MIIDIHCHFTFARRRAEHGPRFSFENEPLPGQPLLDSFVSPRLLARPLSRLALALQRVANRPPSIDAALEAFYREHLFAPGTIDRHVLLAFDAYHDDAGRRPPVPDRGDELGSDIYTSNTLVAALQREHPRRFLFGASIHPYRENALDCLDEVAAAGACLIKWLPLHQNIDIRDPRTIRFLEGGAGLRMPILAHYGEEFTLADQHPGLRDMRPVLAVLRELRRRGRMPIFIVAHAATPVMDLGDREPHELLLDALENEFADAPLYADISALTSWGKTPFLRHLARRQDLHHKLLFGSDFPVPLGMPRLRRDLGREYARIRAIRDWPERMLAVFRHMGFNEMVFHRAQDALGLRSSNE